MNLCLINLVVQKISQNLPLNIINTNICFFELKNFE